MTIQNGNAGNGGAINNPFGTLNVTNCAFNNNQASLYGGAIFNYNAGALTLQSCTFYHNTSGYFGGAVLFGSDSGAVTLTVDTCTFQASSTVNYGGAIYQLGTGTTVNISDSNFFQNSAYSSAGSGGGIYNNNGALFITRSTFNGNSANAYGGGIAAQGGSLTMTKSTVNGNVAGSGGGGLLGKGDWTLTNCTISNNYSPSGGSGVNVELGAKTFLNCTFSGNSIGVDSNATLNASHDIFAHSPLVTSGSGITSNGYNLSSEAEGGDGGTAPGGFLNATGDRRNTNPLLDPSGLQNNGGPTKTFALQPGSPAINAGNPTITSPFATDQRGTGFLRVSAGRIDIGAFEAQNPAEEIKINDTSVTEGNNDNVNATFTVSLTYPSSQTVTVGYATANGTAVAGLDYNSKSGTLSFAPGETTKTVSVLTLGDSADEPNETFFVNLSSPTNATLGDAQGQGTIIDNDDTDTSLPIIAVISPTVNQKILITDFTGNIVNGLASDNLLINAVKVRLNRKRGNVNYYWNGTDFTTTPTYLDAAITTASSTAWTFTNLPPDSKLDAGLYQVEVYAIDGAGNNSTHAIRPFTLIAAATAPTVVISTPTASQKVLLSQFNSSTISGTAIDNIGVAYVNLRLSRKRNNVNYYWNGTDFVTTSSTVNASVTGSTSATWTFGSQTPPVQKLDSGLYQIEAYAGDAAGNKSATVVRPFTLGTDFTPPSVSITSPTTNQTVNINAFNAGTIQGTASDNLGVSSVKVRLQRTRSNVTTYWNGTAFTTTTATVDATVTTAGNASVTWSLDGQIPANQLDSGNYLAYATAYDAAGNLTTSASRTFNVSGASGSPSPISAASSAGGS